jgi:hypothetical protein
MTSERYNHLIAMMVGAVLFNLLKKLVIKQKSIEDFVINSTTTDHFIFISQLIEIHRLSGLDVRKNKNLVHTIYLSKKLNRRGKPTHAS